LLEKLVTACAKYDVDEVDTAMVETDAYEYNSNDGLASWLRENVSLTIFSRIHEKLLSWTV